MIVAVVGGGAIDRRLGEALLEDWCAARNIHEFIFSADGTATQLFIQRVTKTPYSRAPMLDALLRADAVIEAAAPSWVREFTQARGVEDFDLLNGLTPFAVVRPSLTGALLGRIVNSLLEET